MAASWEGKNLGINVVTVLSGASAIASVFLIAYSVLHSTAEKTHYLIPLSVATFFYTFGYLLEICATNLESAFYGVRLQYVGLPYLIPLAYFFTRDIYDKKRIARKTAYLMFLVPTINMFALQAYPFSRLYYTDIAYFANDYWANCQGTHGPLYILGIINNYTYFFLSVHLIVAHVRATKRCPQMRDILMLTAILVPFVSTVFYILSSDSLRFDFNPFAYFITLILLIYAVQKHNLLSIVPLARSQVVEFMEDALIVCDPRYRFLDANAAAKDLFPALALMDAGEPLSRITDFQKGSELCLEQGGEKRYYKATHSAIHAGGKNGGICIILRDITAEKTLLERLCLQATIDPLMHIYNRATFFSCARDCLRAAENQDVPFALMMIDIDHFKCINDTYGHLCGDMVLESVAGIIKNHFQACDIVGRYGGDEISVLLYGICAEDARATAQTLCRDVANASVYSEGRTLQITLSIGLTYAPPGKERKLESLLAQADEALYRAKKSGQNRMCAFEDSAA